MLTGNGLRVRIGVGPGVVNRPNITGGIKRFFRRIRLHFEVLLGVLITLNRRAHFRFAPMVLTTSEIEAAHVFAANTASVRIGDREIAGAAPEALLEWEGQ